MTLEGGGPEPLGSGLLDLPPPVLAAVCAQLAPQQVLRLALSSRAAWQALAQLPGLSGDLAAAAVPGWALPQGVSRAASRSCCCAVGCLARARHAPHLLALS